MSESRPGIHRKSILSLLVGLRKPTRKFLETLARDAVSQRVTADGMLKQAADAVKRDQGRGEAGLRPKPPPVGLPPWLRKEVEAAEARAAALLAQPLPEDDGDAALDARAARLLPLAREGRLGAARDLAALRERQRALLEAQIAREATLRDHHAAAFFARAVHFAAVLERDADGPLLDRVIAFL